MEKFDTSRIKTYSVKNRASKVRIADVSKPHRKGGSFKDFFSSLPNILASKHFKDIVAAIVRARKDDRPVMLGMGAHAIKVGLNPVIIDLMERGVITSLSLNGAGIIQAKDDDVASVKNSKFIYDRVSSEIKEMVLLYNSYHVITADQERETVAEKVADFFHRVNKINKC